MAQSQAAAGHCLPHRQVLQSTRRGRSTARRTVCAPVRPLAVPVPGPLVQRPCAGLPEEAVAHERALHIAAPWHAHKPARAPRSACRRPCAAAIDTGAAAGLARREGRQVTACARVWAAAGDSAPVACWLPREPGCRHACSLGVQALQQGQQVLAEGGDAAQRPVLRREQRDLQVPALLAPRAARYPCDSLLCWAGARTALYSGRLREVPRQLGRTMSSDREQPGWPSMTSMASSLLAFAISLVACWLQAAGTCASTASASVAEVLGAPWTASSATLTWLPCSAACVSRHACALRMDGTGGQSWPNAGRLLGSTHAPPGRRCRPAQPASAQRRPARGQRCPRSRGCARWPCRCLR